MGGEPLPDVTPDVALPEQKCTSRSSRARRRRTSPHSLLFQASAVLECMRIATLYGDFHDIPYLILSDACASAEDLVDHALESMGDDVPDLPDHDSDPPDEGITVPEPSP